MQDPTLEEQEKYISQSVCTLESGVNTVVVSECLSVLCRLRKQMNADADANANATISYSPPLKRKRKRDEKK